MKNILIVLSLTILAPNFLFSQKAKNETLLTIDNKKYSLDDFEYIYNKNNNNNGIDKKTKAEYLDLYVNFKLKVKEAEDRKMDTTQSFITELAGYREQLATPYLTDKTVDDKILKEAYDRLKWDIKASHIMISLPENTSDNDSIAIAAYNKLLDIRSQILKGADFAEMAKKYSDDPSAKDIPASGSRPARKGNGGSLGYFTAFYMVYPFETAAYNTPVGEISMPVRTQFGYHIVKVEDKIPELGTITAKHIMIKADPNNQKAEIEAKAKIDEIYAKIQSGKMTFEDAAQNFSDDKNSAKDGGLLPSFEINRMIPEFIDAISKMKEGEYSKPIQSNYGWHIIKLVNLTKTPPYDEYLPTLKSKVNKDSRSNESKEAAIANFKNEFKFKEYPKVLNAISTKIDSSIYSHNWQPSVNLLDSKSVLFKLDNKKYSEGNFVKYIQRNQSLVKKETIKYFVETYYNKYVDSVVMSTKNSKLEEQNVDFKMLMNEYHDGILLFAISEQEIWNKAVTDTIGLESFYNTNKNNYKWKSRTDATIYKCADKETADIVRNLLNKNISQDSIIKIANKKSSLNLNVESDKYETGTNDIIDQIKQVKGISSTLFINKSYIIVDIHDLLPAQNKTLEEARGTITSDYQNYLEKQWLEKLKNTHKVIVNKNLLDKI